MDIKEHPFEFTGDGLEYTKIWIVNICLTILTLGIYSAWAKVRSKRYFYGNTILAGSAFEYLADPINILKGRLLAVAAFIVYSIFSSLYPPIGLILILLFYGFLPWFVIKALAFRSRYSAYRNVRFTFREDYFEAFKIYILYPILVALTFGLMYAFWKQRMTQFSVNHSGYGTAPFFFNAEKASAISFFKIYLKASLLGAGLIVVLAIFGMAFKFVDILSTNTSLLIGFGVSLVYLFIFAYTVTHIKNLIYSNVAIGGINRHYLQSSLKTKEVMFLYFTNTIGILLTLGLFIPWAMVRMARYRASKLVLCSTESLDTFIASEFKNTEAIGEEFGEVFDLDIGI